MKNEDKLYELDNQCNLIMIPNWSHTACTYKILRFPAEHGILTAVHVCMHADGGGGRGCGGGGQFLET